MDVVGVMAAYLPVERVCTAQCREALCVYCTVYRGTVCVLQSVERYSVCTAPCREVRVCTAQCREVCLCTAKWREGLCVYCTV